MPSAEEREGKVSEELAAFMLERERNQVLGRPPARADHAAERDALEERLRRLKEEYAGKEQTPRSQLVEAFQRTNSKAPIYNDDLPHR